MILNQNFSRFLTMFQALSTKSLGLVTTWIFRQIKLSFLRKQSVLMKVSFADHALSLQQARPSGCAGPSFSCQSVSGPSYASVAAAIFLVQFWWPSVLTFPVQARIPQPFFETAGKLNVSYPVVGIFVKDSDLDSLKKELNFRHVLPNCSS
jgi:hypothetical protein